MKIYLSGKITGDKNYRQKFDKAAIKLMSYGYSVYNPAILPDGFEYEQYMKIDLLALSFCEAIYLLDDWDLSSGSKRELKEAEKLGLKVINEDYFLYMDTLLQLCDDSEKVISGDICNDDEALEYHQHLRKILQLIREKVYTHDIYKTREENFEFLCKCIPEAERKFFFEEFLKEAFIMLEYDYLEEDSYKQKKRIEKMYYASKEIKELCASYYGYSKEKAYEKSA